MTHNSTFTLRQSDIELPESAGSCDEDAVPVYRSDSLIAQLAPNIRVLGKWDAYGLRVLADEHGGYASVHFRIPAALPANFRSELVKVSEQRIPYTDRDREWDALRGGPTSNRQLVSCFVDSIQAAIDFAYRALESAVWAHARGEDWTWPYLVPGRIEDKYKRWGNDHPSTYDPYTDYENYLHEREELSSLTGDDVQF